MNLSMLEKVSTDGLRKMQAQIDVIMKSRLDTSMRPGREATFLDSRKGIVRTIRIIQVNRVSVSATEISPDAGRKWRVGINSVKVNPVERALAHAIPKAVVPHKPVSVGASW